MSTLARYLVFQLPGWAIASVIALGLDAWTSLPRLWLGVALALYVAKDFALFPFVRRGYEATKHEPGHELTGVQGRVVVALDPEGWVEIRHERWRARSQTGRVEVGAQVRVRELQGATLLVDCEE